MKINDYIKIIKGFRACGEALEDAINYKTAEDLWADCKRGDWMLWLIGKNAGEPWSDKRKPLVLTSCKCARLVWDLMPQKSKDCIILFERWANGEDIPKGDLIEARRAAYAAAADAADAAYAAYAAADAADAAAYAAYAAADAADAAYAAADAARTKTLAKCADIVRKDYPNVLEVLKK